MKILKTLYPKGSSKNPYYFDLSDMLNYSATNERYDFIALGIKLKTEYRERIDIWINDEKVMYAYATPGFTPHYMEKPVLIPGDLKNAKVRATLLNQPSNSIDIDVEEMYIINSYYQPSYTNLDPVEDKIYANKDNIFEFRSGIRNTGVSLMFSNGKHYNLQAIEGTLIEDEDRNTGRVIIPSNSFAEGNNTVRIWGLNHTERQRDGVDKEYKDVILAPTKVEKIEVDTNRPSKDRPFRLSWSSSTSQVKYQVKYKQINSEEVLLEEVNSQNEYHIFPASFLPEGKLKVSIRINDGHRWSEWSSIDITTSAFRVSSLEPDNIAQNKDLEIVATWNGNEEFVKYEFEYISKNKSEKIEGTTENKYVFSAGFFDTETVKLKARLFNGYTWSEWRESTFITFGTPERPNLQIESEYNTSNPIFKWDSTGQVSYRLQILKDDIVVLDSSDIYSSKKEHSFNEGLENNTTYTARLRIKNQYEYSSQWDVKTFKISFNELQKPRFDMFKDDFLGRVIFNIYNVENQEQFNYCELFRREYKESEWIKIATNLNETDSYIDSTCRSNILYEYKVRAISKEGGYTDSEINFIEVKLKNTILSDTTNYEDYVLLVHDPKKTRIINKSINLMKFSGNKAPKFEFGEDLFDVMNISFTVDKKTLESLIELYYKDNVLLLRDNRGKKIYGTISSELSIDDVDFMKYRVGFTFTETLFHEGVLE